MNEKGLLEEEILAELSFFSNQDTNFKKVLSSMCTIPHPIAIAAYYQFIHSNIGDPGLFRGTAEMEKRVIEMAADVLNHSDPSTAFGHITSGGTESNIEAVYHMKSRFLASRECSKGNKNSNKNKNGNKSDDECSAENEKGCLRLNLVLPKTAHFSFEKIANLLDIELKKADIDPLFRTVPESVTSLIDENTIGLIGIAGNTEFGECDPIDALSEIACRYRLPLHIDAAFGGFIYPFLETSRPGFGTEFAFDLPGVTSVSLDPHKMGLSVIPAGILVFRNESILNQSLDKIRVKTPYLTGRYQSTITGTRPAAAAAAAYAVMKHLGREGYRQNVAYCMRLTDVFRKELEKVGLHPYSEPQINIVTVPVGDGKDPSDDREKTDKIRSLLLEKYGWNVSVARTIPALRFVLMPHVTEEDVIGVISDLKKLLDAEI